MKNRLMLILFILPFLLSSCTHDMSRKEIDEINMILVLGIDYSEGEYSLSALYSEGGGADPEKGGGKAVEEVANGKGKTAYAALEDLILKNKKSITLAQTGSFLIGEEAAKQGLDQCLDFLSRDETIKMEALLYVVKGKSAAEFIKAGIENKQTIHEDLEAIEQKQRQTLTRNDNTVVNILNDMKQTYSSVLIPYMISEKSGFLLDGYAVFDKEKLRDYLDHDTSDGVNFIRNIVRSYPIYLENEVGLYVSYTNTKLKAELEEDKLTIIVKVGFETMIKEVLTKKDIFTTDELTRLTAMQNDYMKAILDKAVNYSINTNLDILNLARQVENQNFSKWKSIEANWSDMISNIRYEFELQSRISKSFILGVQR